MKKLFYVLTLLSLVSIAVGIVRFDNFRDRLYLFAMLVMFGAVVAGLAHLLRQK